MEGRQIKPWRGARGDRAGWRANHNLKGKQKGAEVKRADQSRGAARERTGLPEAVVLTPGGQQPLQELAWPAMVLLAGHSHQLSRPPFFHLSVVVHFSPHSDTQPHDTCAPLSNHAASADPNKNPTVFAPREIASPTGDRLE